jgi:hypothetical protein
MVCRKNEDLLKNKSFSGHRRCQVSITPWWQVGLSYLSWLAAFIPHHEKKLIVQEMNDLQERLDQSVAKNRLNNWVAISVSLISVFMAPPSP